MKKLDSFVVTSVVNSIINMSDDDLRSVATILAQYPNGEKLADLVGFAIFDNDMVTNGVDLYEPAEA